MFDWFKRSKEVTHVFLDGDIDYVFCFKRKTIIEDKECDYHEFNLQKKNEGKYFEMTHSIRSNSGRKYVNDASPILNECDYCLKKDSAKKYCLSYEARKYFQ